MYFSLPANTGKIQVTVYVRETELEKVCVTLCVCVVSLYLCGEDVSESLYVVVLVAAELRGDSATLFEAGQEVCV